MDDRRIGNAGRGARLHDRLTSGSANPNACGQATRNLRCPSLRFLFDYLRGAFVDLADLTGGLPIDDPEGARDLPKPGYPDLRARCGHLRGGIGADVLEDEWFFGAVVVALEPDVCLDNPRSFCLRSLSREADVRECEAKGLVIR